MRGIARDRAKSGGGLTGAAACDHSVESEQELAAAPH
jgi:hypothetical protein